MSGELELNNRPRLKNFPDLQDALRESMIEHRFSKIRGWNDATGRDDFAQEIDSHAFGRHDDTIQLFLPWVWQVFPLDGKKVVEIGCGTGSTAAAFAPYVHSVVGYDIEPKYADAAVDRLRIQGINNVEIVCEPPQQINEVIRSRHRAEQADILLLFAVLEHQTIRERLDTLRMAREIVRDGGIIVIGETPNRLTYIDRHTSLLPFFNQLPPSLRALYYDRSPRASFVDSVRSFIGADRTEEEIEEYFIRWGDAVSFHEFELTIENIHGRILTDGRHPNIVRTRGVRDEDALALQAIEKYTPHVHPAFSLHYLDLIIQV